MICFERKVIEEETSTREIILKLISIILMYITIALNGEVLLTLNGLLNKLDMESTGF